MVTRRKKRQQAQAAAAAAPPVAPAPAAAGVPAPGAAPAPPVAPPPPPPVPAVPAVAAAPPPAPALTPRDAMRLAETGEQRNNRLEEEAIAYNRAEALRVALRAQQSADQLEAQTAAANRLVLERKKEEKKRAHELNTKLCDTLLPLGKWLIFCTMFFVIGPCSTVMCIRDAVLESQHKATEAKKVELALVHSQTLVQIAKTTELETACAVTWELRHKAMIAEQDRDKTQSAAEVEAIRAKSNLEIAKLQRDAEALRREEERAAAVKVDARDKEHALALQRAETDREMERLRVQREEDRKDLEARNAADVRIEQERTKQVRLGIDREAHRTARQKAGPAIWLEEIATEKVAAETDRQRILLERKKFEETLKKK